MNEEIRYNNRQIERMLDESVNDIKEHITFHIDPLTKQVEKTNGTVKWLTKMVYMSIGIAVVVSPIAAFILKDYLNFKETVSRDLQSLMLEQPNSRNYTKP